jgi:hypothetical protein
MPTMPAHANSLTLIPNGDAAANRVDASRDFMTRHTRILNSGPQALFHKHIAVANAAGFHFHADLSGAWLRNVTFHQFPISARFADLRRLHFHIHEVAPYITAGGNLFERVEQFRAPVGLLRLHPGVCSPHQLDGHIRKEDPQRLAVHPPPTVVE